MTTFKSLDYKISMSADVSGARVAADALGDLSGRAGMSAGALGELSSRSGAMQQAFMGTRMAAEGNVASFFSLARAIRGVATATSGLTAALGVIGMLLAVASVLWQQYKSRQDEAAKSTQEATEKLIAAQQRLHEVIAATRAPSYEPNVKALQAIAVAYSEAEEAAKNYKDTQDQVTAAKTATKVAGIQQTAQRAIGAAAGDEDKQAVIALNAKREVAGVQYEAEYAAIERNAAAQEAHIARIKTQLNDLSRQDLAISGMFSTPLKNAEDEITRIRDEQVATTKGGRAVSPESVDALAKATSNRDKLKADQEKAKAQLDKQFRDAQAAKSAAEQSLAATPEKKKQLSAESAAAEATDYATEKLRVATQDKLRAEKDILKTKEQIRKQAEAETEAVKASGEARADQLEDKITITKIEKERADAKVSRLTERVSSPAARHAQDKAEREEKHAADKLEKQIRQAEEAKARGARGRSIDDLLGLIGAREDAAKKQAELNQLERDAAVAAKEARDALIQIQKTLLANLQLAGAGM